MSINLEGKISICFATPWIDPSPEETVKAGFNSSFSMSIHGISPKTTIELFMPLCRLYRKVLWHLNTKSLFDDYHSSILVLRCADLYSTTRLSNFRYLNTKYTELVDKLLHNGNPYL